MILVCDYYWSLSRHNYKEVLDTITFQNLMANSFPMSTPTLVQMSIFSRLDSGELPYLADQQVYLHLL